MTQRSILWLPSGRKSRHGIRRSFVLGETHAHTSLFTLTAGQIIIIKKKVREDIVKRECSYSHAWHEQLVKNITNAVYQLTAGKIIKQIFKVIISAAQCFSGLHCCLTHYLNINKLIECTDCYATISCTYAKQFCIHLLI